MIRVNRWSLLICLICFSGLAQVAFALDVNDLIFRGADFHYKGDLDQAIAQFKAAVRLAPRNEYAHNQLGILYAKKEWFNAAYDEFKRVIQIDGGNTYALLWLGILDLKGGNLNSAFDRFQKIIRIDPNNAEAYYFLGAIYNFRHNPVKAIEYLKKARDADSGEPDTHYRLGKAFHNLDMTANAMLEYQRTLLLDPKYTKAINETGWIYYNRGNVDKAIAQWKMTLAINSRDRDAIFNLTKAYNDLALKDLNAGNRKRAIFYWEKTLAINPNNKAALHHMKKFQKNN